LVPFFFKETRKVTASNLPGFLFGNSS